MAESVSIELDVDASAAVKSLSAAAALAGDVVEIVESRRFAATTSKKWDGSASRFTDEQYQRSCLIDRGGDETVKERCSLPVLEPDGTINVNALSTALAVLNGGMGGLKNVSAAAKTKAKTKLRSLYKAAGLDVPDTLSDASDLDRHELLVTLGELETVDVPGVEILAAGGPYFGTGSPPEGDTFDESFLQGLADAHAELASQVKVPIKIGHSKTQKLLRNSGLAALSTDEQPAAGWLDNFRVQSGKLLADARGVPKKIADLMKVQAFRSRSVEMSRVVEQTPDGPGRTFDSVVTALALLGAKAPAVRTLDDILAWYGEAGTATSLLLGDELADEPDVRDYAVDVAWDPELGVQDMMSDLANALNGPTPPGYASPGRYWVCDLSIDKGGTSGTGLVRDSSQDSDDAWLVPFTINANYEPTPAPSSDWVLASQKWVKSAGESAAAAMGSREPVAVRAGSADTSPMSDSTTQAPELSDEQVATFADAFQIEEEDADKRRDAVLAHFKSFSGEPAAPVTTPPEPVVETPAASAVTPTELAELQRRAELGERAYEDRRIERRDANILTGIQQGRINPADKAKWERMFDADDELAMTALLAIPPQPRRTFGVDNPGNVELAEQIRDGYDGAYGNLAGSLGITPYSLANAGGQS